MRVAAIFVLTCFAAVSIVRLAQASQLEAEVNVVAKYTLANDCSTDGLAWLCSRGDDGVIRLGAIGTFTDHNSYQIRCPLTYLFTLQGSIDVKFGCSAVDLRLGPQIDYATAANLLLSHLVEELFLYTIAQQGGREI